MQSVHYAAVMFADRWRLVGKGLRWGDYSTLGEALEVAERIAAEARGLGLDVVLHVHDANLQLRRYDGDGRSAH